MKKSYGESVKISKKIVKQMRYIAGQEGRTIKRTLEMALEDWMEWRKI